MHLSPGNSKVNTPPPLEIPGFLNRGGADYNWNSPLLFQIPHIEHFNSRSKYKCLHVISPERNKAILT
jgi:hypothetical protein